MHIISSNTKITQINNITQTTMETFQSNCTNLLKQDKLKRALTKLVIMININKYKCKKIKLIKIYNYYDT